MIVGVPDRLSAVRDVVDSAVGVPGRDSVNDLPVGENVATPMEMRGEVDRGFHAARTDDEPQPSLVEGRQVRRAEHAGISGEHHRRIAEVMTIGETGDDRDKRGGLGRVALETANLQRESGAIHQEADDDLRIDAAFLPIPDLAYIVFILSLEVQRRHVV
jgi:hypothetical protein